MKEPFKEAIEMNTQIKEETKEQEKLLCPKAGTATSSPTDNATSQSFNIVNVMLWMET